MPTGLRGYSLVELVFTVAIAAIVLATGVAMLDGTVARNRQATEIDALFHAIHLARKESILRRRAVSLCPSTDLVTCSPGYDWSDGFILFVNHDRDEPPRIDDNEPVLGRHFGSDTVRITANRRGFTLRAIYRRATNGTLVVCDRAGRIHPKALVVSYTGRPRVAVAKRNGDAYACAD